MKRWMWAALVGAWTVQLIYYGAVGYRTASWDYHFTLGEKSRFGPHPADPRHARDYYQVALANARELEVADGRLARTYHDLGTVDWQDGHMGPAVVDFQRALAVFRRCDGPQSLMVGVCEARLGEIALNQNRLQEASTELTQANGIFMRTDSVEQLRLRNQANLARLWSLQGRDFEADLMLRNILPGVVSSPLVGDDGFRQGVQSLAAQVRERLRRQK